MFPRVPGAPAADGSALGALLAPEEYQAQRQNVFPSEQSLRWFIRRNRALLVERGALLSPTGAYLIDAARFDAVAMEIGHRRLVGSL